MPRIIYIGAKKPHCGKTVFEILANLKHFGVGRILQRNMWNAKYPEPTYYKVVQVAPQMDQELKFGRCWVEEVFLGRRFPSLREIKSHHPDYSLLPRHLEPDFDTFPLLGTDKSNLKILPKTYNCPPVMAEFFNRRKLGSFPNLYIQGVKKEKHGYDSSSLTQFKIDAKYPDQVFDEQEFNFRFRIANEGEEPSVPMEKIIKPRFKQGIFDVQREGRLSNCGGENSKI